jgi:hypothetical protein
MSLIKEELHQDFKRFLKYLLLIDIVEILENNRGMIMYLFPDVKLQKLIKWYTPFGESEIYSNKEIKDKLISINSRLYGDETLKLLYRSLNKVLTTSFSEEERGQRESDVNKLIRKISLYIKNKLTEEDTEILDGVFGALEKTSLIAKSKVIADLDRHMELPDTSKDDETEQKDDVEKTEKDDEEPKKESLHDSFHKRKLKKKIREMIRTVILQKKFRPN